MFLFEFNLAAVANRFVTTVFLFHTGGGGHSHLRPSASSWDLSHGHSGRNSFGVKHTLAVASLIQTTHATIISLFNYVLSFFFFQISSPNPAHSESVGRHVKHSFLPGDRGVRHQLGYGQDTGSQAWIWCGPQPGRRTAYFFFLL